MITFHCPNCNAKIGVSPRIDTVQQRGSTMHVSFEVVEFEHRCSGQRGVDL